MHVELCSQCRFYRRVDSEQGTCRVLPPIARFDDTDFDAMPVGEWPVVEAVDYCGEFRPARVSVSRAGRVVETVTARIRLVLR